MFDVIRITLPGQGKMLQVLDTERPEIKILCQIENEKKCHFDIPIPLPDASNNKFNFKYETCTKI